MQTVNLKPVSDDVIIEAVNLLQNGGLVITPTRTNYNLICDPTDEAAIAKVFDVKKRTKFGPLTLAIANAEQAAEYVEYPDWFDSSVLKQLWPGELTIIFHKKYPFPANLTMGASTLAVACQGESVLHRIVERGKPVGCTSANISGQGDIFVDLDKAVLDIGEQVNLVIDAGKESEAAHLDAETKSNTIIDLTFDKPYLVRLGAIPVEKIRDLIPNLNEDMDEYKARLAERVKSLR